MVSSIAEVRMRCVMPRRRRGRSDVCGRGNILPVPDGPVQWPICPSATHRPSDQLGRVESDLIAARSCALS